MPAHNEDGMHYFWPQKWIETNNFDGLEVLRDTSEGRMRVVCRWRVVFIRLVVRKARRALEALERWAWLAWRMLVGWYDDNEYEFL